MLIPLSGRSSNYAWIHLDKRDIKDHFDKKKLNWKLFSHLITTFIVSTLSDELYLFVNYTTNKWSTNLQFSWFFARIILENKSKWWTVPMIELCCQLVGCICSHFILHADVRMWRRLLYILICHFFNHIIYLPWPPF